MCCTAYYSDVWALPGIFLQMCRLLSPKYIAAERMENQFNMPLNYTAKIKDREINKDYTYNSIVMLSLNITYPEIQLKQSPAIQNSINSKYRLEASKFHRNATNILFNDAVTEYKDSIKHNFPFRPFDAVMKYTVTMNERCRLSTFYDQYVFTGGAHGNTNRFSDSWNLETGHRIELKDLFKRGENYRELILKQILLLADIQMKENPLIYFENYRSLLVKYFNPDSFNLNPDTLSVYYQQYEIGPYVSGIIVFNIPYESLGLSMPGCHLK
jgi:hypothetical protein